MSSSDAHPATRTLAGRYLVGARRGSGLEVATFEGIDQDTGEPVVLKLIHPTICEDKAFRLRFSDIMGQTADVHHPNLARVLHYGADIWNGRPMLFVASEHLGGGSLRDLLDRGRTLSPSQALMVGLEACKGLDALHRAALLHGDVRPATLVFGDDSRLRVGDAGLSRVIADLVWSDGTQPTMERATYASPERAVGDEIGPKSDVYSLALSVVEAATGRVPFVGDSAVSTLANRVDRLLPVNADLGPLAAVLERAARPHPEDRSTAAGFGAALLQAAQKMARPAPIPTLSGGLFGPDRGTATEPTGPLSRPVDPTPARGSVLEPQAMPRPRRVPADERTEVRTDDAGPEAGADDDMMDDAALAETVVPAVDQPAVAEPDDAGAAPTGEPQAAPAEPEAASSKAGEDAPDAPAGAPVDPVNVPHSPVVPAPDPTPSGRPRPAGVPPAPAGRPTAASAGDDDHPARPPRRPFSRRQPVSASTSAPATPAPVTPAPIAPAAATPAPAAADTAPAPAPVSPATAGPVAARRGAAPTEAHLDVFDQGRRRSLWWIVLPLVVLVAAGGALAWYLKVRSSEHPVPVLAGRTEAEARDLLQPLEFKLELTKAADETVPAGSIISTDPAAGSTLTEGDTVRAVISTGPAPRRVPSLIGMTVAAATDQLEADGLVATRGADVFDEQVPAGSVASFRVDGQPAAQAGDDVARGSKIELVVSRGPKPRKTPRLVGLSTADATTVLEQLNLVLDVTGETYSPDVLKGSIVSQDPAANAEVPRGASIGVTISKGPEMIAVPDVAGLSAAGVVNALRTAGLGADLAASTGNFNNPLTSMTFDGAAVKAGDLLPRGTRLVLNFGA